jgi:hypothetical protein
MGQAALLSMVTAFLAFTASEAALFAPLREWFKERSTWQGKLVSCGYCMGFWIALALEMIYRPRLFHQWWPLDHLLTAFLIAWLSAFQWVVLCLLMDRAGK